MKGIVALVIIIFIAYMAATGRLLPLVKTLRGG